MSRIRKAIDSICPFCRKYTFVLPDGIKMFTDEAIAYYDTEVQSVETRTKVTKFHKSCYLNRVRNGGSSLD